MSIQSKYRISIVDQLRNKLKSLVGQHIIYKHLTSQSPIQVKTEKQVEEFYITGTITRSLEEMSYEVKVQEQKNGTIIFNAEDSIHSVRGKFNTECLDAEFNGFNGMDCLIEAEELIQRIQTKGVIINEEERCSRNRKVKHRERQITRCRTRI